jgi:hypothetical protein
MGTFQELADEAFSDLLKKHGISRDLKDALRRASAQPRKLQDAKTAQWPKEQARHRNSRRL